MRTLLLLRGAPGSGKSTWIRENNLEQYTLETDRFRQLISNPIMTLDGEYRITQDSDRFAWDMLYKALEQRMRRGDFTIIDATHATKTSMQSLRGLHENAIKSLRTSTAIKLNKAITAVQVRFLNWLRDKDNAYIFETHIIDIFRDFENSERILYPNGVFDEISKTN